METLASEVCRRKAKELGLDILAVEEAARAHGLTVEDALLRIELRAEFAEVTGEEAEEIETAAVAAAVHEHEKAKEQERDRSGRVRISGYELGEVTLDDGTKRKILRETRESVMRGVRDPTPDEERMVGELDLWLGAWKVRVRHGLGVTDAAVEKLRRVHALMSLLHGWGHEAQAEFSLRTMCRLALMFRLAGNPPPKGTPGTGAEIVESLRAGLAKAEIVEPAWLAIRDLGTQIDDALGRSTLGRGGGRSRRPNIDSEIDRILTGKLEGP